MIPPTAKVGSSSASVPAVRDEAKNPFAPEHDPSTSAKIPSRVPKTSDVAQGLGSASASGSFYAKDGVAAAGLQPAAKTPPAPAARPVPPPRSQPRTSPPPPPGPRKPGDTLNPAVGAAVLGGPPRVTSPNDRSTATAVPPRTLPGGTPTGPKPILPDEPAILRDSEALEISDRLPPRSDTTDVSGPPPTMPPPIPPSRPRPPTAAPTQAAPLPAGAPAEPEAASRLAVPLGEFDGAGTVLEKDKLRIAYEQSTIVRDPANALLGLPEPPQTVVKPTPIEVLLHETAEHMRGDPTSLDAPQTTRFERGDPTIERSDATALSPPSTPNSKLRTGAALRRKRGVGGDVRYVATAVFGVRRARRELAELEQKQGAREQSRRRHLITLGRSAVVADGYDHPALGPAREQLVGVEDERAAHTGQVAAADAELQRVKRDREARAKQHAVDLAASEEELAAIDDKLEPLEKELAAINKRAADLRDSLRRLDAKLAATEASLHSVKGKQDPAAIHAEIATLRADRKAVQRDEPRIASELDALEPKIAALEARRTEIRASRAKVDKDELDDQRRAEELLAAIGAKRKVVDRAASDAEVLRDKILFELGERLYVDRPRDLSAHLAPIDAIDVDIGTSDRRVMELREILGSVDWAKIARGVAVVLLVVGAVAGFAIWIAMNWR